jgi:hypothetical protein
MERWRQWVDAHHPGRARRVGLAWSGRPTHPNDRRRSIRLQALLPLLEAGPVRFVSLQKPMPPADLDVIGRFPGLGDLSSELTDFEDTAALIANLDMVITVDTSVGHLAGALGKAAWIMIPKASDWRWLLDRNDSPWYPTLRLFRQPQPGAWGPLVAGVASALREEIGQQPASAAD